MKKFYYIIVLLGLMITSCKKEPITPNPPVPPNPIDTTDTSGVDSLTGYILFEMYNTTTGNGLQNTVDSIVYYNEGTGFTKTWTNDSITWVNANHYSSSGNYTKLYIPHVGSPQTLYTTVYFNTNETKNCLVTYDDLPGGNWDIINSYSAPIPSEPTRSYYSSTIYN